MTTRNSQVRPIPLEIKAGVHPDTDVTPLATDHYVMSQGIRMFNGRPRKIGGWVSVKYDNNINGITRSLYSTIFGAGTPQLLVGTNEHVYNIAGPTLTNITPFQETSIAIENIQTYYNIAGPTLTNITPFQETSIAIENIQTYYNIAGPNPFSTVSGSKSVTMQDVNAYRYQVGDRVTTSGATGFNGVSAALLNASHVIRSVTPTSYSFLVNDAATATGSGGGAAVNISSGLLTIKDTNHDQPNGNRIKITGASAVGGITAPQINREFIIRNVLTDYFDIMTDGVATSSASNVSGNYYQEIPIGPSTEYTRQGYGAGLYGAGLYGAPGVSTVSRVTPRIWFFDKFADKVVMNSGDKVYVWGGDNTTAPTILPNAPDEVDYIFVSDNILVTLGAGGVGNHIFASDQGDASQWTASSLNQVFEDYIEGAAALISHAPVTGQNLLFSNIQTYTFRYVGLESGVWQIKQIDKNVGIIAPLARVSVGGSAYWMGYDNFYMYRGGNVEIIPANSQKFTTLLNYVFNNINRDQTSKCFAEYNQKYNEVWFHYPTADSEEPNAIARVSLTDFSWVPDRMDRTAAENTGFYFKIPYMANMGTIYQHEVGYDADGEPLPWMIQTNLRSGGKDSTSIVNLVPDSIQNKDINVRVMNYKYPNSNKALFDENYIFKDNSENVPLQLNGHFWQYTISGDVKGQNLVMGQWYEYIQGGSPQ